MGTVQRIAVATLILTLTLLSNSTSLAPVSAQSGNIQTEFLALVNVERASLDKSPLTANVQLESAAYLHSKDMGDNNYFSHTSLDGREFSQRITAAGYRYVAAAENIAKAYGASSVSKVFDMWKNSPGHYANMIGNYVDAGLGVYTVNGYTYYTLDLGKTSSSPTPTPQPTTKPTPTPTSTVTATILPSPSASATSTPTTQPTITANPPTSNPTSTPTIPEITLLALLSSMIILLILTVTIKLNQTVLSRSLFQFFYVLTFRRLVLKHGCK